MDLVKLKTTARSENDKYSFSVQIYVFNEGDNVIAFSPEFDISAAGKNKEEAINEFYEVFKLHIEYCIEEDSLLDDLKNHGWKVRKSKVFVNPSTDYMIKNNPNLYALLNSKKYFAKLANDYCRV